ncbi:carboxypeptidase regulatory-like domain-containing protein [Mumia qirimensis]|uniref:carboxypeptidase regulatory-like domain-containing protein n=1 Tax=Mumia qirimensis TaxID=3234852 RepID=UPI00351CDE19
MHTSHAPVRRVHALVLALAVALGLSMLVAAPAHAATGTVTGRVLLNSTATPAAGMSVGIESVYPTAKYAKWIFAGGDGRFSLTGVPDGTYTVRTHDADDAYADEYHGDAWYVGDATEVVVKNGNTQALGDIVLEKAGFIKGTVKDEFGKPVAGASVSFRQSESSGGYGVTTKADGTYDNQTGEWSKDLLPGSFWVSVSVYDADSTNRGWPYYYVDEEVVVTPGTTTTFDVILKERPTVDFTVLDPAGKPLVDAPLNIRVLRDGVWDWINSGPHTTDAEGRYRFTDYYPAFKVYFGLPTGYSGPAAVGEYWKDASSFETATPVTFPTPQTHAAYTVQLGPAQVVAPVITPRTPALSGSARSGQTLRASAGTWSPAGVALRYQWRANGAAISGATATALRLTNAFAGKRISVTVTGSRSGSTTVARTSAATAPVVGTLSAKTPRIAGKVKKGKKLKAKTAAWGPSPVRLTYQWYRNGKKIAKAKKTSYTLTKRDVGKRITVKVTGKRTWYATVTKTSKKTARVKK